MWSKPNCNFLLFIGAFVAHNIKIIRLLTICKYNHYLGVSKINKTLFLSVYLVLILEVILTTPALSLPYNKLILSDKYLYYYKREIKTQLAQM